MLIIIIIFILGKYDPKKVWKIVENTKLSMMIQRSDRLVNCHEAICANDDMNINNTTFIQSQENTHGPHRMEICSIW